MALRSGQVSQPKTKSVPENTENVAIAIDFMACVCKTNLQKIKTFRDFADDLISIIMYTSNDFECIDIVFDLHIEYLN